MLPKLSLNTQAILLLTAPLITGRGTLSPDLLSPGEYKRLALLLRKMQRQPAELLSTDSVDLIRACQPIIDEGRLQRLLGRGFLLSQAIERWQTRSIWVMSRADADYPRRLKHRLREDAPAVLYGCGNINLLDSGGLAVVGSRHVDETLIDYTMSVGQLVAFAGRTIVSGGAKGIDQSAMRGALEAGGKVIGVLANSLEKMVMNREHRNLLLDGGLLLISPYDPNAGFNVGHAMQRNKLIYALADASLVVSSDLKKGGTWAGAVEQLDKLKYVPVYVRSTGDQSTGLEALLKKGAIPWPNPSDVDELEAMFNVSMPTGQMLSNSDLALFEQNDLKDKSPTQTASREDLAILQIAKETLPSDVAMESEHATSESTPEQLSAEIEKLNDQANEVGITRTEFLPAGSSPAEVLFQTVREVVRQLLKTPLTDAEIAAALNVSKVQARIWLKCLVEEEVIEKQKKPVAYKVKQNRLFE